jgi:hypothetical protein
MPFLQREFPVLLERYRRLYRRNSPPAEYSEAVRARLRPLKEKYGLLQGITQAKQQAALEPPPVQLALL